MHKNIFYELILILYLNPQIRPVGVQAFQAVDENKHFLVNLKQKSCQCVYGSMMASPACMRVRQLGD